LHVANTSYFTIDVVIAIGQADILASL